MHMLNIYLLAKGSITMHCHHFWFIRVFISYLWKNVKYFGGNLFCVDIMIKRNMSRCNVKYSMFSFYKECVNQTNDIVNVDSIHFITYIHILLKHTYIHTYTHNDEGICKSTKEVMVVVRPTPQRLKKEGDHIEMMCCMHGCKGPSRHKPILVTIHHNIF